MSTIDTTISGMTIFDIMAAETRADIADGIAKATALGVGVGLDTKARAWAIWSQVTYPFPITHDSDVRQKDMYDDYLLTCEMCGAFYDDGNVLEWDEFCDAVNDIADQKEPVNVLAAMDKDTVDRAIAAERAYSEAQDEWIEDYIEQNASDPDDDDERDALWDDAQADPAYEAFCDQTRINIAAEHGITAEVLDHAIALMNDGDDALALLDQRRAELKGMNAEAGAVLN